MMVKPSKERMTAAELVRRLETDPEFARRKTEQQTAIAEREARARTEQLELLSDLEKIGVRVESVWDLVNTSSAYREAFPVLLKHLQRPYSPSTREGIARSLAVRAARPVGWTILVDEYCKTDVANKCVKDGLAVALAGASDNSVIHELIDLAKDKRHGESRVLLLLGIRRSRHPAAKEVIADLVNDPQLTKEIKSWRRKSS